MEAPLEPQLPAVSQVTIHQRLNDAIGGWDTSGGSFSCPRVTQKRFGLHPQASSGNDFLHLPGSALVIALSCSGPSQVGFLYCSWLPWVEVRAGPGPAGVRLSFCS